MDNDSTTKAQLQANDGIDKSSTMPKELEVSNFFADPSHQKNIQQRPV